MKLRWRLGFRAFPIEPLLDVVKVEAKPGYILHLEFENGEKRIFQIKHRHALRATGYRAFAGMTLMLFVCRINNQCNQNNSWFIIGYPKLRKQTILPA
jgi:hypothetical protein